MNENRDVFGQKRVLTQLFGGTNHKLAQRLANGINRGKRAAKGARYDDLLFRWRGILKCKAGNTGQLLRGTRQDNGESTAQRVRISTR